MATPKVLCACGTSVLFPNGLKTRTCWKCKASLELESSLRYPRNLIGAPTQNDKQSLRMPNGASPQSGQLHSSRSHQEGGASLQPHSIANGLFQSAPARTSGSGHSLPVETAQQAARYTQPHLLGPSLDVQKKWHDSHIKAQAQHNDQIHRMPVGSSQQPAPLHAASLRQGGASFQAECIANPLLAGSQAGFSHSSSSKGAQEQNVDLARRSSPTSMLDIGAKSPHMSSPSSSSPHFHVLDSAACKLGSSTSRWRSPIHVLWSMGFLCWVALLASIGNVAYFAWRTSADQSHVTNPAVVRPSVHKDTDGDGIPDHHDFCPKGVQGWFSSRNTDYDQDGCADNSEEDFDKDGDGVEDSKDRCPLTPQHYNFIASQLSDFDGDGCYDGYEDHDDDNDNIPNNLDMCPWTKLNHTGDASGCSVEQHERRKARRIKTAEPPRSKLAVWFATLRSNGFEVILGFMIAAGFTRLLGFLKFLTEHTSAERARWLGKVRAILKYALRSIAFILMIFWFEGVLRDSSSQTGQRA